MICPICCAVPTAQATCAECAGRGEVQSVPFCERNWDQITEGLYVGGHQTRPGGGDTRVGDQFDLVVSLYTRDGYGPSEGVPHLRHTMIDGDLDPNDHPHLDRLATRINDALDNNQTVLVRCLGGINRSALVAGLALLKRGWTTDEILTTMRAARSEYVLFNTHFVAHLRTQEAARTERAH